jgi:hypothetical protein
LLGAISQKSQPREHSKALDEFLDDKQRQYLLGQQISVFSPHEEKITCEPQASAD